MSTKVNMDLFRCDKCGKLYTQALAADMCCKQYCCEKCGAETPKYIVKCDACHEKDMFEKAVKLTAEEYEKQCPGYPLARGDENYFDDWDELIEECNVNGCPIPEYVNGTFRVYGCIDPDQVLQHIEEELNCEDLAFSQEAYNEFREFARKWNEEHKIYCYYPDSKTIVFVPDEVRENYEKQ